MNALIFPELCTQQPALITDHQLPSSSLSYVSVFEQIQALLLTGIHNPCKVDDTKAEKGINPGRDFKRIGFSISRQSRE